MSISAYTALGFDKFSMFLLGSGMFIFQVFPESVLLTESFATLAKPGVGDNVVSSHM